MVIEEINDFIERQLEAWPAAAEGFSRLCQAERKPMEWGALQGCVQLNPARIKSTGAAVDKKSIAARPCFLCAGNRPKEQASLPWLEGWEMLLNPYPILPVHFTIASKAHTPQSRIPLEMASMAERAPFLTFFFNGARAGASAPDHLHVQAVLTSELPLMRMAEKFHPASEPGLKDSTTFGTPHPFKFVSAVIPADRSGMAMLAALPLLYGCDAETGEPDSGLVNAFFWMGGEGNEGMLRAVIVPRQRHRPSCYGIPEEEGGLLISPGALDMAGLVITPRPADFARVTPPDIERIYAETAYADSLPKRISFIIDAACN